MEFIGTRGASPVYGGVAILKGIAPDGGLYVPSFFPKLDREELENMLWMDYPERAACIMKYFLDDYTEAELKEFADKAYARFKDGEPAPIIDIDGDSFVMELFHGPTLAFKDVALTILPYLMSAARKKYAGGEKTLILVATSGDTGKAALEGFKDVEGTEIIVFYPSEGVSELQKLQMQTTTGSNVHVVGIKGNFDDAQTAVKRIFTDPECNEKLKEMGYALSSANSINWGRLMPQIVYYVSAYLDLVGAEEIDMGDKINFVVPTGNFGNVLAAYYAMRMGIPVGKLIVASNENNVLTDFFTTGKYDVNRPFHKTMSPSMDILVSSNLERLLFELGDRRPDYVRKVMSELNRFGMYYVDFDKLNEEFPEFQGYSATEEDTASAIDNFFETHDYLLDPHTAVAVSAYYDYLTETGDPTKTVIVSTASPYKFAHDVFKSLTGSDEPDAFRAIKRLHNFTGTEVPEAIAKLQYAEPVHTLVIDKEDMEKTVFDLLRSKDE